MNRWNMNLTIITDSSKTPWGNILILPERGALLTTVSFEFCVCASRKSS